MNQPFADEAVPASRPHLQSVVDRLAELLPAQGPIGIFVHHNTLHAFESRDFEQAVISAGGKLGCEPFLAEEAYREEFHGGRILDRDLRRALLEDLGPEAEKIDDQEIHP
ncbi:MAG: DUF2309 family protein [Elusimicrobia bacterium]|nr:DUF2309 family protein [Elusimicrobiota bacterium]